MEGQDRRIVKKEMFVHISKKVAVICMITLLMTNIIVDSLKFVHILLRTENGVLRKTENLGRTRMAITNKIAKIKNKHVKVNKALKILTCDNVEEYIDENIINMKDVKEFLKELSLIVLCR